MASPRLLRYTVTINPESRFDFVGFLDMLRYEGATVAEWRDSADFPGQFAVTLSVAAFSHQPDRWKSFGLYPKEVAS